MIDDKKKKARDKAIEISKIAGSAYTPEQVHIIKNTVAKETTDTELAYFLTVANSVNLNPFLKQIWCLKDHRNNLLVFAGRDGFLASAQRHSEYGGIRSSEVCENDVFTLDIANNKIKHEITNTDRGRILSAYAIAFRKNGEPTIEYVEMKEYNKSNPKFKNAWSTNPSEMIKKVAESHALKKAFGINIQVSDDWNVKDGVAEPIDKQETESTLSEEEQRALNFIADAKSLEELEQVDEYLLSFDEDHELWMAYRSKQADLSIITTTTDEE